MQEKILVVDDEKEIADLIEVSIPKLPVIYICSFLTGGNL